MTPTWLAILFTILAFLIGVIAGHRSLRDALEREGFAVIYRAGKPLGQGRWVLKRKVFMDVDWKEENK